LPGCRYAFGKCCYAVAWVLPVTKMLQVVARMLLLNAITRLFWMVVRMLLCSY